MKKGKKASGWVAFFHFLDRGAGGMRLIIQEGLTVLHARHSTFNTPFCIWNIQKKNLYNDIICEYCTIYSLYIHIYIYIYIYIYYDLSRHDCIAILTFFLYAYLYFIRKDRIYKLSFSEDLFVEFSIISLRMKVYRESSYISIR